MTRHPRLHCPVCGLNLPIGAVRGHIGQSRCLIHFARNDKRFYDEEHGARIFEAARAMDRAIASYRLTSKLEDRDHPSATETTAEPEHNPELPQ